MLLDDMMAYSEVYAILNLLEKKYVDKVPEKIIEFFSDERLKEYTPRIDVNKSLIDQDLKRETIVLLAILNLNYWCENEDEKQQFLNELTNNDEERKLLKEKYNPDNLFKKKRLFENQEEDDTQIIVYKEKKYIAKLLDKIISFFKKRK